MDLPDLAPGDGLPAPVAAKLAEASARFRAAVGHPVSLVESDVVWLDGGGRALLLPAAPVTAVETVEVSGAEVDGFEWSEAGVLSRRGGWPDRLRSVKVVYSHGYDPVPDEIQEAVVAMARHLATSTPGASMVQVGGQMIQSSSALVAETVTGPWNTVVAAYRLNRGDRS